MKCLYCLEDIDTNKSLFQYLFSNCLLCGKCQAQLKKIYEYHEIKGIQVFVFYEYNDFFEKVITQYKDSGDSALVQLFKNEILYIKKHYPHIKIVIPFSKPRRFHPLKYLLNEFEIIDPFIKTKNIKQSHQNKKNRENIKKIIQLKDTIQSQKIIFFDDVVTSGNTLQTCVHLLKEKNCEVIPIVLSLHKNYKS